MTSRSRYTTLLYSLHMQLYFANAYLVLLLEVVAARARNKFTCATVQVMSVHVWLEL